MKSDRVTGVIFLAIGVAVCLTSLTYPVGTLQKPGGGFFPLLASILLLGLSAIFTLQGFAAAKRQEFGSAPFFPNKKALQRILCGIAALTAYRYLMPIIGFAPATVCFIFILSRFLEGHSWPKSIFFSLATGALAYYLFQVLLKIAMPIPMIAF
ncbi:MAG: tripartite tricarboxylate transporter TctB family protein [Desulfobacterales bacterium]|jgi:hypothetical protein|nr:tripartite tricarboxylate transporter TctB family protein [Desulfobacterales bacterium]